MVLAVIQASSVFKTCLFSRDGFSLQGYEGPFRHEHSVSSIVKPQSPRGASPSGGACSQSAALESFQAAKWENADALSVSVFTYMRLKNTGVCQRKGNSGLCFHFVWLLLCLCLRFVYLFAYVQCCVVCLVGGLLLRHLEPANGQPVIQLGSLSSRVMPPWRGWHTLLERTLPGRSREARNS